MANVLFLILPYFQYSSEIDLEERYNLPGETDDTQSLRVRLDIDTIKRIDTLVGRAGRQRFIREAVLWRLNQELPPIVLELQEQIKQLQIRVSYLENLHSPTELLGNINEVTLRKVCRDDTDRKILQYFIQNEGATTPELAASILGSKDKRRTILDRIAGINKRAEEHLGSPILALKKGTIRGKRGAWWLVNPDMIYD